MKIKSRVRDFVVQWTFNGGMDGYPIYIEINVARVIKKNNIAQNVASRNKLKG